MYTNLHCFLKHTLAKRKTFMCIIFTLGKGVRSLVEKANGMKTEIQEYLQNYTPSKSLPKIGDNIFTDYVDKTKGISEE